MNFRLWGIRVGKLKFKVMYLVFKLARVSGDD